MFKINQQKDYFDKLSYSFKPLMIMIILINRCYSIITSNFFLQAQSRKNGKFR